MIVDIREDMARITKELERVLGPSKHEFYLHYIRAVKDVLPNSSSNLLHHILPRAVFPEFADLREHQWNGIYLTRDLHLVGHALLLADYPGDPRLSDALKMVWHITSLSLGKKKVDEVIKCVKAVDGKATVSATRVARRVGVSVSSVLRVLRGNGIKPMTAPEANRMPAKMEKRIIRLAKAMDSKATLNAAFIARKVGCAASAIKRVLKRNGIKSMTISEAGQVSAKSQERIIRLARVADGKATVSVNSIARKVGDSRHAVWGVLRRNGIKTMTASEATTRLSVKKEKKVIRLAKVVSGKATVPAKNIARMAGVTHATVRSVLNRNGYKPMTLSETAKAREARRRRKR